MPVSSSLVAAAARPAATAQADPSIGSKRAQAQQVLAQLRQLDASAQRANNRYQLASVRLQRLERSLRDQHAGARRRPLATSAGRRRRSRSGSSRIYTTRDEQSTLGVLLGAKSLDDLVSRIETVNSVSRQDAAVIRQVVSFRGRSSAHAGVLRQRAPRCRTRLVRGARRGEAPDRRAGRGASSGSTTRSSRSSTSWSRSSSARPARRGAGSPRLARAAAQRTRPTRPASASPRSVGERLGRAAVALRRRRRDRDALPRRPVRVGRREPERLRLLRARHVRLRAGRRLAAALHRRPVGLRRPRLARATSSPATSSSSTGSATSASTSAAASSSTRRRPATSSRSRAWRAAGTRPTYDGAAGRRMLCAAPARGSQA